MEGFVVVTNGRAGKEAAEGLAAASDELRRSGEVEVVHLDEHRAEAALDEVLDRLDERVLVIAGGDGTIHSVAQRLWDRHELGAVTIGLLPLGTGNDLARCLRIPLTPVGSAATIRFGRPAVLDVLVDDGGTVVVNAAHAGVASGASARAESLKPYIGRAAYKIATSAAGVWAKAPVLRVDVDDETIHAGAVLLVAVMNGSSSGGGAALAPAADPGDGAADVVVVADEGRLRRAAIARALRAGRLEQIDGVSIVSAREVLVSGAPTRHNVDGEVGEPIAERRYRVVGRALRAITGPAARAD